MKTNINYIFREVSPEQTDFSYYFDDEGLTGKSGDYCNNLFIVAQSRNHNGFNETEYQEITSEVENLLEQCIDIFEKSSYSYSSVGDLLLDYKLINNIKNTKRIKQFKDFFKSCLEKPSNPYRNYYNNYEAHTEEKIAEYLTLKTGKQWVTDEATGYCQGDYVKMVYCEEHYPQGVKNYGEIYLGAGKEFILITLENGEETVSCGGFIVSDSQAWKDEDYKKLLCEMEGLLEAETTLQMIEGAQTYTNYTYRTA